jgi:hypothetical protein
MTHPVRARIRIIIRSDTNAIITSIKTMHFKHQQPVLRALLREQQNALAQV